jgi:hypothetical protein
LITYPDAGVAVNATSIDLVLSGLFPKVQAFVVIPSLVVVADGGRSVRKAMDGTSRGVS